VNDAERVIRQHAQSVMWQMIVELIEHFDDITQLAITRSGPGSIGEAEYGDASFHKPPTKLRTERFEEYADAVFYGCVERHITTGSATHAGTNDT
jgi:hypothetical protein